MHRRDVRTLTREPRAAAAASRGDMPSRSLAAEVVGRWMHERRFLDRGGHPKVLPRGKAGAGERGTFDDLVEGISRDVRPRAVLDELQRLGVAEETEDGGVRLLAEGFAPKRGFDEMAALFAANLHDHAAAAVANLRGEANFLEQAVFVDEIGEASVKQLRKPRSRRGRRRCAMMGVARQSFDADRSLPADQRGRRARFGVYFFSEAQEYPE
ncbi:MAG: DUF6502 family protein [Rubrivivax sp.]